MKVVLVYANEPISMHFDTRRDDVLGLLSMFGISAVRGTISDLSRVDVIRARAQGWPVRLLREIAYVASSGGVELANVQALAPEIRPQKPQETSACDGEWVVESMREDGDGVRVFIRSGASRFSLLVTTQEASALHVRQKVRFSLEGAK